ncbi:MAG TPA: hypothetical protein VFW11_03830 [Cyclobacteriaceae bacterium]|nr:hypothetical protein [Cyclobacteriaceae bacterium]
MNKNRVIFYLVFGAFHLFLFLFSLYVDGQKENVTFLLSLQGKIWLIKYGAFFGLMLLVTDVIWQWRIEREYKKNNDQLNHELTHLKAKLFDLQEEAKKITPPQSTQENK